MEKVFYILLSMKTPEGWVEYGRFLVGEEHDSALLIFSRLAGDRQQCGLLRMDLLETKYQTDTLLRRIYCTLDQITENSRLITKEVFKRFNLEGDCNRVKEHLH